MSRPQASVVIPAHDEEMVLPDLLSDLEQSPVPLEIVVVANACTDATVAVASERARVWRDEAGSLRVEAVAIPSKVAALNRGDEVATVFPRLYLDADVRIDPAALGALVEALAEDGPMVAAPRLIVRADHCSYFVRQYYRVWMLSDYLHRGHVGSGIYAVNAAGRRRWGKFPDVVADDRFVQNAFSLDERRTLSDHVFTVPAPATLRSLVRRGWRIHAGNTQLSEIGATTAPVGGGGQRRLLARVVRRPALWPAFGVYASAYAVMRWGGARAARHTQVEWRRDESSRRGSVR